MLVMVQAGTRSERARDSADTGTSLDLRLCRTLQNRYSDMHHGIAVISSVFYGSARSVTGLGEISVAA